MSTLTLRLVKGTALTWQELDDNFTNLNNDKYESGDDPTFGAVTAVSYAGLPVFNGSINGIVNASGASGTKFLRGDGTWAVPAGASVADGDYGDITVSASGATWTIDAGTVTLAKMANIATASFIGRTTAGTGVPEALTVTQATALLNNMVGDSGAGGTKGLVPAPAAGDAAASKFLKADGTWATAGGNAVSIAAIQQAGRLFNATMNFDGAISGYPSSYTSAGTAGAPGVATTNTRTRTLRRSYSNGSGSQLNIRLYPSTAGLVFQTQSAIALTAGFTLGETNYDVNQGFFVGLNATAPDAAVLAGGATYFNDANISSLLGIGTDYNTNAFVAVAKIGTGTSTTYALTGLTRDTSTLYKVYMWKTAGQTDMSVVVEQLNSSTGAVTTTATATIPWADMPTAFMVPVMMNGSITAPKTSSMGFAYLNTWIV
jgi:hypothetical protein